MYTIITKVNYANKYTIKPNKIVCNPDKPNKLAILVPSRDRFHVNARN